MELPRVLFTILFTGLLISCATNEVIVENDVPGDMVVEETVVEDVNNDDTDSMLSNLSYEILDELHQENWVQFSERVHPSKGARISPDVFIQIENDLVFTREDITQEYDIERSFGLHDGTGLPMLFSLRSYLSEYALLEIEEVDEVSINETRFGSTSIDTTFTFYDASTVVEFYKHPTEPDGLDYQALRMVFEESEGEYYLVGLVSGYWTI